MALLKEGGKRQVKEKPAAMQSGVRLVTFTQEMECLFCEQTRELIEEVGELSERIAVEAPTRASGSTGYPPAGLCDANVPLLPRGGDTGLQDGPGPPEDHRGHGGSHRVSSSGQPLRRGRCTAHGHRREPTTHGGSLSRSRGRRPDRGGARIVAPPPQPKSRRR